MRNKWLFGFLALLLLTGAMVIAFSSDFKVTLLRSYATSVMRGSFGGEFSYGKARFLDDDALEIDDLTLGFRSSEEDHALTLFIEKTRVEMGFSLWPLSLTLHAYLDKPKASIERDSSLTILADNFKKSASLMTVKADIDIRDGIISFEGDQGAQADEYKVEGSLHVHDPLRSTLAIQSAGPNPFQRQPADTLYRAHGHQMNAPHSLQPR